MSINYKIQARKNPLDLKADPLYYLSAKSVGHVNYKVLIDDMVRNTSLTRPEAASAVYYLFDSIPRFLKLGFTVQLGEMGYFRLTLRCKGAKTPEEATVDKIKGRYIKFFPGKALRESIKDCAIEKRKD